MALLRYIHMHMHTHTHTHTHVGVHMHTHTHSYTHTHTHTHTRTRTHTKGENPSTPACASQRSYESCTAAAGMAPPPQTDGAPLTMPAHTRAVAAPSTAAAATGGNGRVVTRGAFKGLESVGEEGFA